MNIVKIGRVTLEFSSGATGFSVDSWVDTDFGRRKAKNQVFWSGSEMEARAFFNGMCAALAMEGERA